MSFLFILFDGPTIQDPFCWIYKMNSSVVRPDRKTLKMDGHDSEDTKQSTADMTAFVQNLLQQMQSRFQTMSDSIITKNILFSSSTLYSFAWIKNIFENVSLLEQE
ncbi:unnamed protein product [Brassica napus]|uniref:(rape) hypothetical protein n=1 Tax=Brassica napus TaxID=3708 RepID=A0A816RFX6_BRANA|nr:unnamed protein product [Brassica napus]